MKKCQMVYTYLCGPLYLQVRGPADKRLLRPPSDDLLSVSSLSQRPSVILTWNQAQPTLSTWHMNDVAANLTPAGINIEFVGAVTTRQMEHRQIDQMKQSAHFHCSHGPYQPPCQIPIGPASPMKSQE